MGRPAELGMLLTLRELAATLRWLWDRKKLEANQGSGWGEFNGNSVMIMINGAYV